MKKKKTHTEETQKNTEKMNYIETNQNTGKRKRGDIEKKNGR